MTQSPIPAPKVLLIGGSGTGKTHSLRTLIDVGITPFILFTEPGMEVVGDIPCPKLHWHYIPPATSKWETLLKMGKIINLSTFEGIANLQDSNRSQFTQLLQAITLANNFVCQRCKQEFGDVGTWGTDRAYVNDSLTGINQMTLQLVVGQKPIKAMGEWQIAQNYQKNYLDTLTTTLRCWLIMIAHVEREHDEITGGTHLMVSAIGRKLAPVIPIYFSDVIQTLQKQGKFSWSTDGYNVEVKGRNVPIGGDLPASFVPLAQSWMKRGGIIEKGSQQAA